MRAHGDSKKLKGPRKYNRLDRGRKMSTCCALSHFTYSGHIIRFMLQCKLAAWLSGYIIWEPSLKSTEAGDGNWRIYVSWHALLAHCPPPLSLPASSLVYTAIFNPIFQNWQPYIIHILLSPLFFFFISVCFYSFSSVSVHVLILLSVPLPPADYTLLHYAGKWHGFSAVHLIKGRSTSDGGLNASKMFRNVCEQ